MPKSAFLNRYGGFSQECPDAIQFYESRGKNTKTKTPDWVWVLVTLSILAVFAIIVGLVVWKRKKRVQNNHAVSLRTRGVLVETAGKGALFIVFGSYCAL